MRKIIAIAILSLVIQGSFAQFITNSGIEIRNSATLVTTGDWSNSSGNIINNGVIRTNSAFVNNGTLSKESTGGFVLDFTTDTQFTPGGPAMGFVTKNGAGVALVTISAGGVNDTIAVGEGNTYVVFPGGVIRGF